MNSRKRNEQFERLKSYCGVVSEDQIVLDEGVEVKEEEQCQVPMELLWNPEDK